MSTVAGDATTSRPPASGEVLLAGLSTVAGDATPSHPPASGEEEVAALAAAVAGAPTSQAVTAAAMPTRTRSAVGDGVHDD